MGARPSGAGEGWAPTAPLNLQEGNRARPGALQVLKLSAEGNAPKTFPWTWLRGWTQALAGVVGAADPIIPRGTGDQQAAGVEVAVPVLRSTKARVRPGGTVVRLLPPGPHGQH